MFASARGSMQASSPAKVQSLLLHPNQAVRHQRRLAGDGVLHHRVRGGVHALAVGILDPRRRQLDDAAVGLQNFDAVPHRELAALGAVGNAVLPAVHRADEIPVAHIGVAGSLLGLLLVSANAES